jgi:D-beta-D-heptose 7-phosphate kinase/D-beta-D-heptose 1-phosphate adenosyltransferase
MSKDIIKSFLDKNRSKVLNIHCVGDAMVDEYYQVKVNRISPEFPMPIMTSVSDKPIRRPGGVANVAHQFKHFNVTKTLICFPDRKAERVFSESGVARWGKFSDIRAQLPIKRRFLDGGVQVVRHDIELSLCGLKEESINHYHELFRESIKKHGVNPDVVIFSDYNKGFFSEEFHGPSIYPKSKTIVDPKKGPLSKWKGCTIFKPNVKEAEELSGKRTWKEQAKHLQNELECEAVVITCGGEKVAGVWKNEFFCYSPHRNVEVESVVGAGDCFCAFFGMAIGHGFSIPEAAEIAWNAGAVYVQRKMNRPIVPAELSPERVVHPQDLTSRDFKLVITNGCFDVLHSGHLETLKFAKSKGDKLVVAVNSDTSVRGLKGGNRPVVPLEHRMKVLAALEWVDFVVPFDEISPLEIIKEIRPDVLVKGADYEVEKIVGADMVPEVYRAPIVEGVSTTKLLDAYLQEQP